MTSASESAPAQAKTRRRLQGVVVSSAADKTIKVRVERRVKHRLYGKVLRRHSSYLAHDPDNACRDGDKVVIEECPRFSKRKSWLLSARLSAARAAVATALGDEAAIESAVQKPAPAPASAPTEATQENAAAKPAPSAEETAAPVAPVAAASVEATESTAKSNPSDQSEKGEQ